MHYCLNPLSRAWVAARRQGAWQEVEVPLRRFLLTWKGRLVEERSEMNPARVFSLGIGLAGGPQLQAPGPFCLGLDWVKARRATGDFEPRDRSRDLF